MPTAHVYSRADLGWEAPLICVESHIASGLPRFTLIGLPEAAVRESKDRVRSALLNANFRFPPKRITVNLAPADLPKSGGRFDLPIALSILAASEQINTDMLDCYEFAGELGLEGQLRATPNLLPFIRSTFGTAKHLIIPAANKAELQIALSVGGAHDTGQHYAVADDLLAVCAHLSDHNRLEKMVPPALLPSASPSIGPHHAVPMASSSMPIVHCAPSVHRAVVLAAAGCHNLLLCGPPGNGKSTIARCLHALLPPLMPQEALNVAMIHTLKTGKLTQLPTQRPLRTPHHTCSTVALIGGGSPPQPGEISQAQHGVLLLDELPEFSRQTLEALRQPLESGDVCISRARYQSRFPAVFQLVATMNPCPCGYAGSSTQRQNNPTCQCTPQQIQRYLQKISGPLLDRIDIKLWVPAFQWESDISPCDTASVPDSQDNGHFSQAIQEKIAHLHLRQRQKTGGQYNSQLNHKQTRDSVVLDKKTESAFLAYLAKHPISLRAYYRTLRLAKTIADVDAVDAHVISPAAPCSAATSVSYKQLMEALHYQHNPLLTLR